MKRRCAFWHTFHIYKRDCRFTTSFQINNKRNSTPLIPSPVFPPLSFSPYPVDIAYQTVYACISDCCRLSQIVISLDKGKLWNNDCGNFVIPSTMSYVEINRFATKRKILNNFLICKTMWNHSSTLVIGTFQVVFSSSQTSIFTGASCQPEISKYSIKTSGKMTHSSLTWIRYKNKYIFLTIRNIAIKSLNL